MPKLITVGERPELVEHNKEFTLFIAKAGLGRAYVPPLSNKINVGSTEESRAELFVKKEGFDSVFV